jgi:hypothetical protein
LRMRKKRVLMSRESDDGLGFSARFLRPKNPKQTINWTDDAGERFSKRFGRGQTDLIWKRIP